MENQLTDHKFKESLTLDMFNGLMVQLAKRGLHYDDATMEKMGPLFTKYVDTMIDLYAEYTSKIDKAGLYMPKDVAYPFGGFLAHRLANSDVQVFNDDQPRATIIESMRTHMGDDTFNAIFKVAPDDPSITAHITIGVYAEWKTFKAHELYDMVESWGSLTGLVLSAIESTPVIADMWNKHTDILDDVLIITDLAQEFGVNYARDGLSCTPSAHDVLKETLASMLDSDEFALVYPDPSAKKSKSAKNAV